MPVWLIILSDQLPVFALVSFYLTNKLMGRRLVLWWRFKGAFYHSHRSERGLMRY